MNTCGGRLGIPVARCHARQTAIDAEELPMLIRRFAVVCLEMLAAAKAFDTVRNRDKAFKV